MTDVGNIIIYHTASGSYLLTYLLWTVNVQLQVTSYKLIGWALAERGCVWDGQIVWWPTGPTFGEHSVQDQCALLNYVHSFSNVCSSHVSLKLNSILHSTEHSLISVRTCYFLSILDTLLHSGYSNRSMYELFSPTVYNLCNILYLHLNHNAWQMNRPK